MESLFADTGIESILGILTGFFLVVVVPLVAMLLAHQRRMAEFIHRQSNLDRNPQIDRLEGEVKELKERINHLIIQAEDKRALQERVGPPKLPEQLR